MGGFLMTKVDPGRVVVKPGDSLSLLCVVDSSYEYCKWINPQGQECDFEWKRAKGLSRRRRFSTASTMIESVGSQLRVPPSKTRALGGARLRSMFSLDAEVPCFFSRGKFK